MNLESRVQELNLYRYQIDLSEEVNRVTNKFKRNPDLPGVVLLKKNKFLGMISQKNFWKYMSRPYSLELASKRSIAYLCDLIDLDSLIVDKDTLIVTAVQKSLERSPELLEEPIVVQMSHRIYQMVDIHQLLVAYAQIHQSATQLIQNMYKELDESRKKLEDYSKLDEITHLPNRRVFDEYLQTKWELSQEKKTLLYLIICEIDYFKEYNDIYGYIEGDKCLRKVANIINELVKDREDIAARYGGCKLTIILSNKSGIQAGSLAEYIRNRVSALKIPNPASKVNGNITMSFGIASMIPCLTNAPNTLIRASEQALYQAKKVAGGNCKIIWNSSFNNSNYYMDNLVIKN